MVTSGAALAAAAPALQYSLAVRPPKVLLGGPVTAVLSCMATAESVEAMTSVPFAILISRSVPLAST